MRGMNQWSIQKTLVFHATLPMNCAALQPIILVNQCGQYLREMFGYQECMARKRTLRKKNVLI